MQDLPGTQNSKCQLPFNLAGRVFAVYGPGGGRGAKATTSAISSGVPIRRAGSTAC